MTLAILKLLPPLLLMTNIVGVAFSQTQEVDNQTNLESKAPNESVLESGDLLWIKHSKEFVLYGDGSNDFSYRSTENDWTSQKELYLSKLESKNPLSDQELQRYKILTSLSYRQFVQKYESGDSFEGMLKYSGPIGVGHIAIVKKSGSDVTVIEAVNGVFNRQAKSKFKDTEKSNQVREISYAEWEKGTQNYEIWHGRLSNVPLAQRELVAKEATKYLGYPYNFWKFNLEDIDGFYCSKLVWLTIRDSIGLYIDGNSDPDRNIWLSPKQLLESPHIKTISSSGSFVK